jgi:integrase
MSILLSRMCVVPTWSCAVRQRSLAGAGHRTGLPRRHPVQTARRERGPSQRGRRDGPRPAIASGRRRAVDRGRHAPHLRALIIGALSTGCRVGELLTLQWQDVQIDSRGRFRALVLRAGKTKTGTLRIVPVGQRLAAVLEMLRTDPEGEDLPGDAFVFGDEIGQSISSVKTAWRTACAHAGIEDLHFHDLRREFACRLLESRAELHDVRDFLGHANITTTSR